MQEITIYPIDALRIFQFGMWLCGAVSIFVALIFCCVSGDPELARAGKRLAWGGIGCLILCAVGGLVRYNLECNRDYAIAFEKLPARWAAFSESLAKIKRWDLRHEAITRFVKSNPPVLSAENYATLLGDELWKESRTPAHKSFKKAAGLLDDFVILEWEKPE